MHPETTQRILTALAAAAEAAAPIVQREFQHAYGNAWLERVNADRKARNQPPARGLHDHRFVLGLVAHDPLLARVFDENQREAAKVLNGIGNAIVHNEPLRSGYSLERAEELAQQFERHIPMVGNAADVPSAQTFLSLIEAFSLGGRPEDALRFAEQWIAAEPHAHQPWLWKTRSMVELGRHEEALAAADRWIAVHPSDPGAWSYKRQCLAELGRHEEAREVAQQRTDEALAEVERLIAMRHSDPGA